MPVLPEASSVAVQEASAAAEDDQEAGQASDDGPPEVRRRGLADAMMGVTGPCVARWSICCWVWLREWPCMSLIAA